MYLSSTNIFQSNEDISSLLQLPAFINFDFSKSTPIISPDKTFALFYNEFCLINVDLKTKKIKWYKTFQKNEKISNVQISPDNQISFVKKLSTHNEIITLSNNNMNYNELKVKENILGYKLFESPDEDDPSDMVLIINDFFQMSLYKDNILQKSVNRNILKDVPNGLIQANNKILKVEFILEQKLILVFFDNGLIVNYSIFNKIIENEYENEETIEYENYIDLNLEEENKYLYNNIILHRINYICNKKEHENEIMEVENNDEEEEEINEKKKEDDNNLITTFTTFLILSINKSNINKKKSTLYFLKLENGKFLNFKNEISFDNKEIIDSYIFKYKLNNDENDINDFIFVLFKHTNVLNNNKFMYSTEYSDLYFWFNLDKDENMKENNNFEIFKFFDEYPNNHIYLNNIIIANNKKKIFNINYLQLGEKVSYFEKSNENLESVNNLNNIEELLKSNNYNDYITFMNSPNYDETEFRNKIINRFKSQYHIDLDQEIFKIKNKDKSYDKSDISKINYFLLNLIANQALFKIKSTILKRNALNTGFIFPIDELCLTCKILLKSIKTKIIGDNKGNPDLNKILEIIINILKIVKNRNRTYNDKLFGGEKEIILEQESIINSMIFDTIMTLFISKIQSLLDEPLINNNEIIENKGYPLFNIFSLKNQEKDINDINIQDNLYKFLLVFNALFTENNIKNIFDTNTISLDSLLYLIKFFIFNQYYYFIFHNIKNEAKNEIKYFKPIISEYKTYNEISKVLFTLDNINERNENINFSALIKFMNFLSDEKLFNNEELNKVIHMDKLIYKLIKSLYDNHYFDEAFNLGNCLLSAFSSFDEINIYLLTILELKDYPLAYSLINNCLSLVYKNTSTQEQVKKIFESENYYEIKNLYLNFYEYLIKNKAIDVLFKLSLNAVEIYIFKEICEENEKYKEFLIIYYLIIGKINEAKYQFQRYLNSNFINESQSKNLYANLIKYYETLMNKNDKKEKIDDIIDQLSTENKFLIKIDDEKERKIIEQRENLPKKEYSAFSEFMLKSSLKENKILSGLNFNINDYTKFSSNLSKNKSYNFNNKLSINLLNKIKNNDSKNIQTPNNDNINIIMNENSNSDME